MIFRIIYVLAAAIATTAVSAAPALAQTLSATFDQYFGYATGWFVGIIFYNLSIFGYEFPWIVGWLVIGATVFTIYFGFVQFRMVPHSIALVRGDYSDPDDAGEVSHFQALATALSGTVGLGNIAGVAVAVGIGGPGATFWMILAGLLGMASKFTECTLGVKYRNEYEDGTVSGGPMYYMTKGFAERGLPGGKVLGVMFAIFCILGSWGGGNMFQSNQAHAQLTNVTFDYPGWITGIIFAAVVFMVIIGGLKSIASVTEKVVPFMGILYVGTALLIILMNYNMIGAAFSQIFAGAFTESGIIGGAIGALIQGFRRAAFSNEAGVGSAAIAHSAVRTKEPVTEGFVSLLEPFIDTVVICTMTALVIIITNQLMVDETTGQYLLYTLNDVKSLVQGMEGLSADQIAGVTNSADVDSIRAAVAGFPDAAVATINDRISLIGAIKNPQNNSGVALTSAAFSSSIGWFRYVLALAVVLFAFSTMISWSYYGLKSWTYLFGEGQTKELIYKLLFCFSAFLLFCFSAFLLFCFSAFLLFCFSAFLFSLGQRSSWARSSTFLTRQSLQWQFRTSSRCIS